MRVVIAGGGTGGHLFPALAIAQEIKMQDPGGEILFVGTHNGIEARIIPQTEFPIKYITARGIRKTGLRNIFRGLLELPGAFFQSVSIIREFRPDFVLGVGGYASGPTVAAAVPMRIPNAIQEQNSVMGTTNRLLCTFVDKIFVSWEETTPAPPARKTLVTGNPIRKELLQTQHTEHRPDEVHVLIFGGSRGARNINQSIAQNLDLLKPLANRIKIVHQTGPDLLREVFEAYKKAGVTADVKEFIYDMRAAYEWADLVVCRSGASSLAELTALGKPAIVVPYPYAIGDHQTKNARLLEAKGALKVVPDENLRNGALVKEIRHILEHPEILIEMADNSKKMGMPNAGRVIAQEIIKTAQERK